MAGKGWLINGDLLVIDDELYDQQRNKWVRDVNPPRTPKPSSQEAYKEFLTRLRVNQNKSNGLVSISIEFYSPSIARQWVSWLVEDINTTLKQKEVDEARRSIEYLENQLKETALSEMKSVFYQLIEEQTKTIMLSEVRDEYVFATVDVAVEPEVKTGPQRVIIVIVSGILGGIAGLIGAFFLGNRKNK